MSFLYLGSEIHGKRWKTLMGCHEEVNGLLAAILPQILISQDSKNLLRLQSQAGIPTQPTTHVTNENLH